MGSFRGLAALAIGALFLAVAAMPGLLGPDRPPGAVRALLAVAGGGLAGAGAMSLRWMARRRSAVREGTPEEAIATLAVDEDSESTSYTLTLHLNDGDWTMGVAGGAALAGLGAGRILPCRVWRHGGPGGAPVAVEIGGRQVETLPLPSRIAPPHPQGET